MALKICEDSIQKTILPCGALPALVVSGVACDALRRRPACAVDGDGAIEHLDFTMVYGRYDYSILWYSWGLQWFINPIIYNKCFFTLVYGIVFLKQQMDVWDHPMVEDPLELWSFGFWKVIKTESLIE